MKGKSREGKKWKRLSVRLLPEEWDFLRAQADELGMSVSDFVRSRMCVGSEKEYRKKTKRRYRERNKEEHREVAAQIARVGNNINQLARWANTHKSAVEGARMIVLFSAALAELKRISSRFMGE